MKFEKNKLKRLPLIVGAIVVGSALAIPAHATVMPHNQQVAPNINQGQVLKASNNSHIILASGRCGRKHPKKCKIIRPY